jgi:hypothetical protein
MCASPLEILRAGPPPPRVVLLPDGLFFVRSIPIVLDGEGTEGQTHEQQVASQVEFALEAASPFPLLNLYYGHYWLPGESYALIYASYRRRFSSDQTEVWSGSDLVCPTFIAAVALSAQPSTTVLLSSPEGLTAIHWSSHRVPNKVVFEPVVADATDEQKNEIKTRLLKNFESLKVIEINTPIQAAWSSTEGEIDFTLNELTSTIHSAALKSADVRDKGELASLQKAKARDRILWNGVVAAVGCFALLAVCELILIAGGFWQNTRKIKLNIQAPMVAEIMNRQEVANRINDLSTRRLLPIEMIQAISPKKKSYSIYFSSVATNGLYGLTVEAQTPNATEIKNYENDLRGIPACQSVVIKNTQSRNNITTFTLVVTFAPNAIKPNTPKP